MRARSEREGEMGDIHEIDIHLLTGYLCYKGKRWGTWGSCW